MRLQPVVLRLVSVLLGTSAAFLLLEVALRVGAPRAAVLPDRGVDRAVFCQYDPLLGYDGIPGLTAGWSTGQTIRLNSRGDRDVEHALERRQGILRAVLLGDSFFWGYGVRDPERASELVARYFEDASGRERPLEVVNLAVSGYGTDQELLKYLLKGSRYEQDAVVLGFYSGNDALENAAAEFWNCPKPRIVEGRNGLLLTGVPVRRLEGWANNRIIPPTSRLYPWRSASRLVWLLSERELPLSWLATDATAARRALADARVFESIVAQPAQLAVDRMEVTTAIVEALLGHLRARGIPLVLVLIPSADLAGDAGATDADDYAKMRLWARDRNVPTVDFLAVAAASRHSTAELYWNSIDGHWSPLGNDLAARAVAKRLAEVLTSRLSPETAARRGGGPGDDGGAAPDGDSGRPSRPRTS
jgi:lysophospholipase L1-like esterase